MTTIATPESITPSQVSAIFWKMGEHFKELLEHQLRHDSPGVVRWDVQMLPAHEIVTFEHTAERLVVANWVTANPLTVEDDLNEIAFTPGAFDLLFSTDIDTDG